MFSKNFLIFSTIFIFVFLLPGVLQADEWCPNTWSEYSCENASCDGNILVKECGQYCDASEEVCVDDVFCDGLEICMPIEICEDVCISCATTCSAPSVYTGCENWQACQGSGWSTAIPQCKCEGDCLETPQNDRYYDNPNYSNQSDKDIGSTDIKLPVKLDWDDIEGWKQGAESPQSYNIRIQNTTQNTFSEVLDESEYIPNSCLLKSNTTHNWGIEACCSLSGTNCGSESVWNLTTNIAPELVSPYDPDWQGSTSTINASIPITFDWCDVDEANFYLFKLYAEGLDRPEIIMEPEKGAGLPSEQIFGLPVLTKENLYQWEIFTCPGETVETCKESSQLWNVSTSDPILPPPDLIFPKSQNNVVNLSSSLRWQQAPGAYSYRYEIKEEGEIISIPDAYTDSLNIPFSSFWNFLSFDTAYEWHVQSCWKEEGVDCEEFSATANFKTTGAPPTNLREESVEGGKVSIPAKLNWDNMPGAASYRYQVATDSGFNNIVAEGVIEGSLSEILINYPNLLTKTDYWWHVKTCADSEGNICGQDTLRGFTTFKLSIPHSPNPENGGTIFTGRPLGIMAFGVKFYQYKIEYLSQSAEEKKAICPSLVGQEVVQPTTAQSSSFYPSLECLGGYRWQVRACLDIDCQAVGEWSPWWNFTVNQPTPSTGGGIVPCGRSYDDLNTPWNERESCQFKHIFLTIKIIINFLLFRLVPLSLVLLTIATGVMFYFSISAGTPAPIARVKSIWKSAGWGLGIIFSAWLIVNWLLSVLGFQVGIFGQW